MRWTPDRTPSRPRRPPHRRRRSNGISTATRPAARCGRTVCSSCRISRATAIGNSSRTLYSVPSAAMRNGNFSELLSNLGRHQPADRPANRGHRRSDAVHRRRHDADVRAVSGQHHSRRTASMPRRSSCSSSIRSPTAAPVDSSNNYLALQDREIDKYQYTQRMDLLQSSASTWMGRYSYAKENEVSPALKLNGTKLDTRVHQVVVGNTWTLSSTRRQRIPVRLQLLLQHVRTRAGVRARRRQGAEHPGHLAESSRGLGHPVDRHHRVQRLRRQHRRAVHEPQSRVRVQQQPVVDSRAALVQGRRQPPLRHVQPGRQPVCARQLPVSEHRHRIRVRRLPARLRAADRIRGGARGDEVPRAEPGVLLHRHVAAHART